MGSDISSQDQMNEYLLARIAALEAIVMLLWNDHPNRNAVRNGAQKIFESEASNDLASSSSDTSVGTRALANKAVFERVFSELLSESHETELRRIRAQDGGTQ